MYKRVRHTEKTKTPMSIYVYDMDEFHPNRTNAPKNTTQSARSSHFRFGSI